MSLFGKGGSQQVETQPWGPASSALEHILGEANQSLWRAGGGPSMWADPSQATQRYIRKLGRGGPGATGVERGAGRFAKQVLGGKYLTDPRKASPGLGKAINRAQRPMVQNYQRAVQPGIDAGFAAGGRTGSGAHYNMRHAAQQDLAQGLGDVSGSMSFADYNAAQGRRQADLDRMRAMTFMAPQFAQMQDARFGRDMGLLEQQGSMQDALAQRGLDEHYNRLQRYASMVQPAIGAGSTTSQPTTRSPVGSALGAGMAGAGMAGMASQAGMAIPGWGWGAAIGVPALMGLLG